MALGCDTAAIVTAARLKTLQAEGFKFVGRYLNQLSSGAHDALTKTEAKRISAAGLFVFSIYENGKANSVSYFTRSHGISDAKDAVKLAKEIGQPSNTPIYFTVDTDVTETQVRNEIVDYFQGVLSIIDDSNYLLGVYGPARVCQFICGDFNKTNRYAWFVDNSWLPASGAYNTWNMRQYKWDKDIGSGSGSINIEYDESSALGGGGWRI